MRHRVKAKHLNRDSTSRKALFKNMVSSVIESGEIETTETKAKIIKGLVDKLIHKAQEGTVHTRRVLARFFGRRDVVNDLVDKVAPAMKDRTSGFTRITRIGKRRGDDAMMVKLELVNKVPETSEAKKAEEAKPVKVEKKAETKAVKAPAKKK